MLEDYAYELPDELVAKTPASPRDSARLMVVDTESGKVSFDIFRNIDRYLPEHALLVLNDTKVLPARITLHKNTGGKVVVLFLINEWKKGERYVKGMVDRGIEMNAPLYLSRQKWFIPVSQNANIFTFEANFPLEELGGLMKRHGATPIPPYLRETPLSEAKLRSRYQTIFAKQGNSVAAPTASLHFTERVFKKLKAKHIGNTHVTLNVGMGTFASIDEQNFESKKLHEESYDISRESAERIRKAKEAGRTIVAVGTTAMRTLESAAARIVASNAYRRYLHRKHSPCISGSTDLFIYPPYEFKVADALITNFHVPESSLMCLVDAFLQHKQYQKRIMELYKLAIKANMRFFSFGDAMLIL